jgi:hypothetical protein
MYDGVIRRWFSAINPAAWDGVVMGVDTGCEPCAPPNRIPIEELPVFQSVLTAINHRLFDDATMTQCRKTGTQVTFCP